MRTGTFSSQSCAHIACTSRVDMGLPYKKQINFCLNVLGDPSSHPKKRKPHVAADHLLQHVRNYRAKKSSGRCGWHGIPHYCQPLELKWMSRIHSCNAPMEHYAWNNSALRNCAPTWSRLPHSAVGYCISWDSALFPTLSPDSGLCL